MKKVLVFSGSIVVLLTVFLFLNRFSPHSVFRPVIPSSSEHYSRETSTPKNVLPLVTTTQKGRLARARDRLQVGKMDRLTDRKYL